MHPAAFEDFALNLLPMSASALSAQPTQLTRYSLIITARRAALILDSSRPLSRSSLSGGGEVTRCQRVITALCSLACCSLSVPWLGIPSYAIFLVSLRMRFPSYAWYPFVCDFLSLAQLTGEARPAV